MLVLARQKHERIILDDGLTIEVVQIRGDDVKIGIYDPHNREIHREEVWERIMREKLKK